MTDKSKYSSAYNTLALLKSNTPDEDTSDIIAICFWLLHDFDYNVDEVLEDLSLRIRRLK